MNENLNVVPCLSVRVGGINRGADCLFLSSVWAECLPFTRTVHSSLWSVNDMLNTSHKVFLPRFWLPRFWKRVSTPGGSLQPDAVASTTGLEGGRAGLLQDTFVWQAERSMVDLKRASACRGPLRARRAAEEIGGVGRWIRR
ncbi:hypothetical protein XH79_07430 [Bradyrhizobium sp. CCBAU 45389]|nr:hypothetical protein [Bradyrhizobium sp. CCBAU 45389]